CVCLLTLPGIVPHRDVPSFPTRRSSDLGLAAAGAVTQGVFRNPVADPGLIGVSSGAALAAVAVIVLQNSWLGFWVNWLGHFALPDRKSTRLNSSHVKISYAVFCLKKKNP